MSRIARAVEFIEMVARMSTTLESDQPPSDEDGIVTLDRLIHKAREISGVDEDGAGMEIMHCDDCNAELEEGRIGLCDGCTPLPLVTPERLEDLACQCFNKSQDIDAGIYGTDEDNESWAANLRRAASRLRNCLNTLNGTDLEEIQCGTDATEDENEYLRSQSEAA